ncbi:hypothetical protein CROQUDRAFT_653866 [Cronartium quercuum f. sp. fusiforme G11]|uniref:L-serine ammonia-lyase n=1 Tax=Cronartium quercuum f. sp. fusiforme G11 TaxID=708437 RepID=A0A9P6TEW9_9BASI|nr:hypothetical protein CROQUDRAFT_653866 [Cronartium quercuum f. sp. fusiforme G11]
MATTIAARSLSNSKPLRLAKHNCNRSLRIAQQARPQLITFTASYTSNVFSSIRTFSGGLTRFQANHAEYIPENLHDFPVQPHQDSHLPNSGTAPLASEGPLEGIPVIDDPTSQSALHAVVSTFDLFSIGIGPSSSHTVGPMRAAKIFVTDLKKAGVLKNARRLKVALYGSLAATGKGHMSPEALIAGFEGCDCETVPTHTIPTRYQAVCENKSIVLGAELSGGEEGQITQFDIEKDMVWLWDRVLPQHPNGMLFSVYDEQGDMIASNTYFSIGGGFVVNKETQFSRENLYYKQIDKRKASATRLEPFHPPSSQLLLEQESGSGNEAASASYVDVKGDHSAPGIDMPPLPFHSGDSLLELTRKHNLTIAQIVFNNERQFLSSSEIRTNLMKIYQVMDESIRQGVCSNEDVLPGRLRVKRRAKNLYRRLHRGFFPSISDVSTTSPPALSFTKPNLLPEPSQTPQNTNFTAEKDSAQLLSAQSNVIIEHRGDSRAPLVVRGRFDHEIPPVMPRRTTTPSIDFLSCYAIAVNEVNAAGGRIVTAPTNGAAGVIPAVLKYFLEFISEDHERDTMTFLLTAAAIGMLYKRGATISAAEGGCMAEVGVACSMAAGAFAACMGGSPEVIETAAEIGIEHCLGLTCDPIDGLVQIPCIERNALGAVKAVSAAQLALSGDGVHSVSLDEAIAAMRQTAKDMSSKYKETSRAGLATSVKGAKISVSVPDC